MTAESQPISDLLCENPRSALLHGGSVPRGHEDLDGCHSNRRRGLHPVYELRYHWGTEVELDRNWASSRTPASGPSFSLPELELMSTKRDLTALNVWTYELVLTLQVRRCSEMWEKWIHVLWVVCTCHSARMGGKTISTTCQWMSEGRWTKQHHSYQNISLMIKISLWRFSTSYKLKQFTPLKSVSVTTDFDTFVLFSFLVC